MGPIPNRFLTDSQTHKQTLIRSRQLRSLGDAVEPVCALGVLTCRSDDAASDDRSQTSEKRSSA